TASRYTQRVVHWPADSRKQLPFILKLLDEHQLAGWTLFPSDDEATAFLARNHSKLTGNFRLTTPPWESFRWTYDKRLTYRIAAATGVDQPMAYFPRNREDVAGLNCSFPAVLKPAFKPEANRFTQAKAWRANDRAELLALYDQACRLVPPGIIMIQEFI